jgi:hypothetical protein
VSADAYDPVIIEEQLVDSETFTHLDASLGRSVHEQLVECCPTWAVRNRRAAGRTRCSTERDRTEVEGICRDWRTPRRHKAVEEPPPIECGDARRVNEMRGRCIGGKMSPVHKQDSVPLAS